MKRGTKCPSFHESKVASFTSEPRFIPKSGSPNTTQCCCHRKHFTELNRGPKGGFCSECRVLHGKCFRSLVPKPRCPFPHLIRVGGLSSSPHLPAHSLDRGQWDAQDSALLLQDSFTLIKVESPWLHFHPQTINISGLLLSPGWQKWPPPCLSSGFQLKVHHRKFDA